MATPPWGGGGGGAGGRGGGEGGKGEGGKARHDITHLGASQISDAARSGPPAAARQESGPRTEGPKHKRGAANRQGNGTQTGGANQ